MTTHQPIGIRQDERGNVLFLILIAVALFAALSYAVTQSTRSGSGDANSETSLIDSAQVTQYPAGVRTSVVRMVIGNTSVDQLLFDVPSSMSGTSADVTDPNELSREVFYPTGGGAVYEAAPKSVLAAGSEGRWVFTSQYKVDGIGITDNTTASNEIIAFLPGVTQGICKKLNDQLGITVTGSPADGIVANSTGPTYTTLVAPAVQMAAGMGGTPGIAVPVGTITGDLISQPFGCYNDGTGKYIFYSVLVER